MTDRVAVISDIHGNAMALRAMLTLADELDRRVVFVGDYVDRGSESSLVLTLLLDRIRLRPDTVCLAGNHDQAFLACLEEDALVPFLQGGGAATVLSYIGTPEADVLSQLRASVPLEHVEFLRNLQSRFEVPGLLVTHDRGVRSGAVQSVAYHVYGHSVQASGIPALSTNSAAIDTGCGALPNGRLTCFLWPERSFFQVDELGHRVS